MRRITKRLTRKNAVWFLKTNATSWVIQGAIFGLLTVAGAGALGAAVSAKATAYVVWVGQLVQHAKGE